MLDAATCGKLARQLDEARRLRREIEPLSKTFTELDLDDAYRIQRMGIGLRVARGEVIAGYKMGLTSKAKREQMGLAQSVYGVLTDAMRISDGAEFQVARGIHPKVEPEIAFVTSRELRGAGDPRLALPGLQILVAGRRRGGQLQLLVLRARKRRARAAGAGFHAPEDAPPCRRRAEDRGRVERHLRQPGRVSRPAPRATARRGATRRQPGADRRCRRRRAAFAGSDGGARGDRARPGEPVGGLAHSIGRYLGSNCLVFLSALGAMPRWRVAAQGTWLRWSSSRGTATRSPVNNPG